MKNLNILVVEDETLAALSIISQLKEIGYNIVGDATDGIEAIELCEKLNPDLIIMDINMPRLSGIQAAKIIRERFQIPVIIVSGYSDRSLIQGAADAGVFNYLIKPVTKLNLAPAIEVALKNFEEYNKVCEQTNKLKKNLEERKLVERAKGILMLQKKFTEDQAMRRLQLLSNNKNIKIADIAKQIIEANELLK